MATRSIGRKGWGGGTGGVDNDEKVKVTSNDTTADFLLAKLAAGGGINLTELNDGGDEDVEIASSGSGPGLDEGVSTEDLQFAFNFNGEDFFGNFITDASKSVQTAWMNPVPAMSDGGFNGGGFLDYTSQGMVHLHQGMTMQPFSVALWWNRQGGDGTSRFLFGAKQAASISIELDTSNQIVATVPRASGSAVVTSSDTFTATGWHHVVLTWDGTTLELWIDGVSVGTDTTGTGDAVASKGAHIGGNANGTDRWNGFIGQAVGWSRKIEDSEITAMFNTKWEVHDNFTRHFQNIDVSMEDLQAGSNVAEESIDDGGNLLLDSSNAYNDLDITDAPVDTGEGYNGSHYLVLDGTEEAPYLTVPNIANDEFTIAFWMRSDDTGNNPQTIFTTNDGNILIQLGATGEFEATVKFDTEPDLNIQYVFHPFPGEWMHVAVRLSGGGALLELFTNGISVDSDSGNADNITAITSMKWGASSSGFIGGLDDMRIYSNQDEGGSLTDAEIKSLFLKRAKLPVPKVARDQIVAEHILNAGSFNPDSNSTGGAPATVTLELGAIGSGTNIAAKGLEFLEPTGDPAPDQHASGQTRAPKRWPRKQIRYNIWFHVDDASAGDNIEWDVGARSYANEDALAATRTQEVVALALPATTGAQNNTALYSGWSDWFTPAGSPAEDEMINLDITRTQPGVDPADGEINFMGIKIQYR